MKVFIVALIAFVAYTQALTPEEKTAMAALKKDCVESSKVDEANIKKLRAKEDVSDDALKKYVGCMFAKLKFINEAGELQEDAVKAKIPADFNKDEADKIIKECKASKGKDADETSFLAYKCFLKNTSMLIQFE